MPKINQSDNKIKGILQEAKILNTNFMTNYRVYMSIMEKDNPTVLIELNNNKKNELNDKLSQIRNFLSRNNIETKVGVETDQPEKYDVYVALRSDLLEVPKLASAILTTIVMTLEGKIPNFDENLKLSNVPKFPEGATIVD